MRVLVDADACPVKQEILRQCKARRIPVVMLIDTSHELHDGYSTVITVDKARDSVDLKLINLLSPADVVVTQDYGVAAMALGKGAMAIHQSGTLYTKENIDRLLFERHLGAKLRRAGKRAGNTPKRTREQDRAFERAFAALLDGVSEVRHAD